MPEFGPVSFSLEEQTAFPEHDNATLAVQQARSLLGQWRSRFTKADNGQPITSPYVLPGSRNVRLASSDTENIVVTDTEDNETVTTYVFDGLAGQLSVSTGELAAEPVDPLSATFNAFSRVLFDCDSQERQRRAG